MAARVDTKESVYKYRDAQGKQHMNAEIYADEASDIAGKTEFNAGGGVIVADPDSAAYVVHSGKMYIMDGDSIWYDTSGNEVS